MELAPEMKQIIIEVLCDLQGVSTNKSMAHYTAGIEGCGTILEQKIKTSFFRILSHLPNLLAASPEDSSLMKLFEWRFSTEDYEFMLEKLQIFKIMTNRGESSMERLLCIKDSQAKLKLQIFKQVFFSIISRVAKSEVVETVQIEKGNLKQTPNVSKRQSPLNVQDAEQLIGQAYKEIFLYFWSLLDFYDRIYDLRIKDAEIDYSKLVTILDSNDERVIPVGSEDEKLIQDKQQKIMTKYFTDKQADYSDRLGMLQLHINVSLVHPMLQQMLASLVTPLNLGILLRMLQVVQIEQKVQVVKILDGLRESKLPLYLFDETAEKLMESSEYSNLPQLVMKQHLKSPYCQLLYLEAAKIRHYQSHASQSPRDEGNKFYAVSCLILRLMLGNIEQSQAEEALCKSFVDLEKASKEERQMLFDMHGTSISFISLGGQAVLSKRAFTGQHKMQGNEPKEVVSTKSGKQIYNLGTYFEIYDREELRNQKVRHSALLVAPLCKHGQLKITTEVRSHLIDCLSSGQIDCLSKISILKSLLITQASEQCLSREQITTLLEKLTDITSIINKDAIKDVQELSKYLEVHNGEFWFTAPVLEHLIGNSLRKQLDFQNKPFSYPEQIEQNSEKAGEEVKKEKKELREQQDKQGVNNADEVPAKVKAKELENQAIVRISGQPRRNLIRRYNRVAQAHKLPSQLTEIFEQTIPNLLPQTTKTPFLYAQAWYGLQTIDENRQRALSTIQLVLDDCYKVTNHQSLRLKSCENWFKIRVREHIINQSLSLNDIPSRITACDFTSFYEMLMQLAPFNRNNTPCFYENITDPSFYQAKEQKRSKLMNTAMNWYFKDGQDAGPRFLKLQKLLILRLAQRLMLELECSEQMKEAQISTEKLQKLLDLLCESKRDKLGHLSMHAWRELPKGFEQQLLHDIMNRYTIVNGQDATVTFLTGRLCKSKLEKQIQLCSLKVKQVVQSRFIQSIQETLMAQWVADQGNALIRALAPDLVQDLLLSGESNQQKCLIAISRVMQAICRLKKLEKDELLKDIWSLQSLQSILEKELPKQADEMTSLGQYKLVEICSLVLTELGEKYDESNEALRLAKSFAKLKQALKAGFNYDQNHLDMLVAQSSEPSLQVHLDSSNQDWQKIDFPRNKHDATEVKLSLAQQGKDGFEIAKCVCLIAAISTEPKFNESTKVVPMSWHKSECSLKIEVPKSGYIFVKYPLNQNQAVNLRQKTEQDEIIQAVRHLDTPFMPGFSPSQMKFSETGDAEVMLLDDENRYIIANTNKADLNPNFWMRKNRQGQKAESYSRLHLPANEKVKQISFARNGWAIDQLNRNDECFLIVTESGKLYRHHFLQENSKNIEEQKLPGNMEKDDKIVGTSDWPRFVWSQKGHIFDLKESCCAKWAENRCKCHGRPFQCVSQHELADGSKIKEVHEIAVRKFRSSNVAFARVTTTRGDQVVLSREQPDQTSSKCATIGRRKDLEGQPAQVFHMLDYDYERIRFSQISCNSDADVAIDQYGEVWYIGGTMRKLHEANPVQVQQNSKKPRIYIDRPICSNLMREKKKKAVKVCSGQKQVAVITKDRNGTFGLELLFKSHDDPDISHRAPIKFRELAQSIFNENRNQISIIDASISKLSQHNLFVIYKPNLAEIHTTLKLEARYVPDLSGKYELSDDPVARSEAIQMIDRSFKRLQLDKSAFNYIRSHILSRETLSEYAMSQLEQTGIFKHDMRMQQYAKQYLHSQQALFDSIYLYSLVKEDHYKREMTVETEFERDFEQCFKSSKCDLLSRLMVHQMILYKRSCGNTNDVSMNRIRAAEFVEERRYEKPGEVQTLFTQLMCHYGSGKNLDINAKQPFQTNFYLEHSADCGGPMRDTISQICNELMSSVLPLLRPTANNRCNLEPETDCYQLNEKANESHNMAKFTFLGYLLGWSFYSIGSLNLDLPTAFWARLCGGVDYVYTLDDVRSQDILLAKHLERLRDSALDMSKEDFDSVYCETTFVLQASHQDSPIVELCPGGAERVVTQENAEEYVLKYLHAYTKIDEVQFTKLYYAFEDVATRKVLALIHPIIARRRICSSSQIDLASFKASTDISRGSEEDKRSFWQLVEELSNEDRQLLLKFMCGRQRLQPGSSQTVLFYGKKGTNDDELPVSQTCNNQIVIPRYSSLEVMKKRILTAIQFCGEVDGDGDDEDYGPEYVHGEEHRMDGVSLDDREQDEETTSWRYTYNTQRQSTERQVVKTMASVRVNEIGDIVIDSVKDGAQEDDPEALDANNEF